MKWLRLYSSVLHDPKVQRLSPAMFKHWINLLCLANEHEPHGTLPEDAADIAFALRIKPSEAAQVIAQLERAGLVDRTPDGRRQPHNWPQRQRKSDDVAERVRAHRARKPGNEAKSSGNSNDNVTLQVTLPVTPRNWSRAKDTDTDTDEDSLSPDSVVNGDGLSLPFAAADADGGGGGQAVTVVPLRATAQSIHANGNGHLARADVAPTPPLSAAPPSPPPAETAPDPPAIPRAAAASGRVDLIWEVLCEVIPGGNPATKPEKSRRGKVVRDLKDVGATPDEVRRRAARYAEKYGEDHLTDTALVAHWGECDPDLPMPLPRAPYRLPARAAAVAEPERVTQLGPKAIEPYKPPGVASQSR